MNKIEDYLYTLQEVARIMRISDKRAYELARSGQLPGAFKLGRLWRVRARQFDLWISELSPVK